MDFASSGKTIVSQERKIFMMKLLYEKNYLHCLPHVTVSDDHPLPETKVPYAWLMQALCVAMTDNGGTLARLDPDMDLNLDALWEHERGPLVHTRVKIECKMKTTRDVPHKVENDICYTQVMVKKLGDKQLQRKNQDVVSKPELFVLIKSLFPAYCEDNLTPAPIVAAHRNWYLIILLLACTNSTDNRVKDRTGGKTETEKAALAILSYRRSIHDLHRNKRLQMKSRKTALTDPKNGSGGGVPNDVEGIKDMLAQLQLQLGNCS